jgi:hypothetical protein
MAHDGDHQGIYIYIAVSFLLFVSSSREHDGTFFKKKLRE